MGSYASWGGGSAIVSLAACVVISWVWSSSPAETRLRGSLPHALSRRPAILSWSRLPPMRNPLSPITVAPPHRRTADGVMRAHSIHVLTAGAAGIAGITVFLDAALFSAFALPLTR